jgi:hypothetical protein
MKWPPLLHGLSLALGLPVASESQLYGDPLGIRMIPFEETHRSALWHFIDEPRLIIHTHMLFLAIPIFLLGLAPKSDLFAPPSCAGPYYSTCPPLLHGLITFFTQIDLGNHIRNILKGEHFIPHPA